jgi:RNA polymerase sigma factor (sigma-70 family)
LTWTGGTQIFPRDSSKTALEERFQRLLSTEGAALLRLAGSYTRGSSDRDDLFQDIVLAIWGALPSFRSQSSERTFIFRIAHNRAIRYSSQRQPPATPAEEIEVSDPRPGPEKGLATEQQETRLLDAIRQLPVSYRQVITLTLEDLSYAEIAQILGINENNVGVRLNRARQLLRRLLET